MKTSNKQANGSTERFVAESAADNLQSAAPGFFCQNCGQPCDGRRSINTGARCRLCGKQTPETRPLGELLAEAANAGA